MPLWPSSRELATQTDFVSVPTLIDQPAPSHTARRRRLGEAFLAKNVAPLEPRIRGLVVDYITAFADNGHADLVGELAWDCPLWSSPR